MRRKIVRTQKVMWRNIMKSTKSQKASVLHYSIDIDINMNTTTKISKALMAKFPKKKKTFFYVFWSNTPLLILI